MTSHPTGTRTQWNAARLELLGSEKEHTRRADELARQRQALPWVRVDKAYAFDTPSGRKTLDELFEGRSQLMIYHFMFGADYEAGCPSCSSIADGFNGVVVHLMNHDVMFSAVSLAPLAKLDAYKKRMGWSFPWASSSPSDFNADFNVWFSEEQQRTGGIEYNFRREKPLVVDPESGAMSTDYRLRGNSGPVDQMAAMTGTDLATYQRERPGISTFVREGDAIYHTYSSYARGVDGIWSMYHWLDRAPKGRNEQGVWWRRHDEYGRV